MSDLAIEVLRVASLVPYARNSRTHSDAQVAQIAASIREFGFTNPVLISADSDIIAGHGRVRAAQQLGMASVPCIRLGHLTKAQRQAYVIADNRLALNAGWDTAMLSLELGELKDAGVDLELLGFEEKELAALLNPEGGTNGLTDPDEVPEQVETRCKPGDLWLLGSHRLLCGDSRNVQHVEQLMGGEKADMVYTDPPYGMHLDTDFSSMKSKFGPRSGTYAAIEGDNEPFDPAPLLELFCDAREAFLWGADYYAERIVGRLDGSWVVWDKRAGDGVSEEREQSLSRRFGSGFELCWSRNSHQRLVCRILWNGMFGMGKDDEQKRIHPTQKPVALAEWFFERWGKPDDLVADLFLGSGSTLIACEKTGRRCFGMEIDPHYCDIVIERWERFTGKEAIIDAHL